MHIDPSIFFNLMQFQKCLIDIDLAINNNCPVTLLPVLARRRVECEEAKAQIGDTAYIPPKLSFEPHNDYPSMANVLEIHKNDEFGRHVIANCDIGVGKIVLVEIFFAATVFNKLNKECTMCQELQRNFIACDQCSTALFCSKECKELSTFHKYECGVSLEYPETLKLIIRTVLIAISLFSTVDELMDFIKSVNAEDPNEIPNQFMIRNRNTSFS